MRHRTWVPLTAAGLWVVTAALLLTRFPSAHPGESEYLNHIYNLAFKHHTVFDLYDDVYPPVLYAFRTSTTSLIRPFFIWPAAAWVALVGFSFIKVRLFGLSIGVVTLGTVYLLGTLLHSRKVGFLAMSILATRFIFIFDAGSVRPDTLLCLAALLIFLFLLWAEETQNVFWMGAAGLLAGLAPGIHTNGICFILPVITIAVILRQWRGLAWAALGWLGGSFCFIVAADWDRFLPGLKVLFWKDFMIPPLFRYRTDLFAMGLNELNLYFDSWMYRGRGGMAEQVLSGWQSMLYMAAGIWGIFQKRPIRFVALFALSIMICNALAVAQQARNYQVVLEPFFALLIAAWILTQPWAWTLYEVSLSLAWFLLLFPLGVAPVLLLFFASRFLLPYQFKWFFFVTAAAVVSHFATLQGWGATITTMTFHFWFVSVFGAVLLGYLAAVRRGKSLAIPFALFSGHLLGFITLGTGVFIVSSAYAVPPLSQICKPFKDAMKPSRRVMGPQILWPDLYLWPYRDIGVLALHRWMINQVDLWLPLEAYKPDYLILDESTVRRLARLISANPSRKMLPPTGLLPWPHRVIHLSPGLPFDSPFYLLVEINWENARSRNLLKEPSN